MPEKDETYVSGREGKQRDGEREKMFILDFNHRSPKSAFIPALMLSNMPWTQGLIGKMYNVIAGIQ